MKLALESLVYGILAPIFPKEKDSSSRLQTIWKKTMASRENIASGIFVLSPEGVVLSHYAYLMQFLNVETRSIFPFWAIT